MTDVSAQHDPRCPHCGAIPDHEGVCPRIKKITYHREGEIESVEYHQDWSMITSGGHNIKLTTRID